MKYRKGSFIVVPNQELLCGLPPRAQCLYLWLCFHANQDGECFPSRKLLGLESGMNVRTVDRMMKYLVEKGLVAKKKRGDGNIQLTNLYFVSVDEVATKKALVATKTTLPSVEFVARGSDRDDTRGATETAHGTQSIELNPIRTQSREHPAKLRFAGGVAAIIQNFRKINPAYQKFFANKTQRSACERMEKTHGLDRVLHVSDFLPKSNKLPYFPTITTPAQLEEKWAALEAAVEKYKVKKTEGINNFIP